MPNWCSNNLLVSGEPSDLEAFKAAVSSVCTDIVNDLSQSPPVKKELTIRRHIDFNRILPMPTDPKEQLAQTKGTWPEEMDKKIRKQMGAKRRKPDPSQAWYNWRLVHWDTKWNLDEDTRLTEEPGKLVYYFDTAWSPPIAVVVAMSEQHPRLTFLHQYWELANDFAGWGEYRQGVLVDGAEGDPSKFDFVPVPEPEEPELVPCSICGEGCMKSLAHRHQDKWIGDECCWDERLRASE